MTRCIVVVAIPRSGSSAVAGALHYLGVVMGERLQQADHNNRRGYYEDLEWQAINKRLCGQQYTTNEPETISEQDKQQYRQLIRRRVRCYPLWGFKSPRACFCLQHVWPLLQEVDARMVVVRRPLEACTKSLWMHSLRSYGGTKRMTKPQARALASLWSLARDRRIIEFLQTFGSGTGYDQKWLSVGYDALVEKPADGVKRLAEFAYRGLRYEPTGKQMKEAIGHITKGMRHWE